MTMDFDQDLTKWTKAQHKQAITTLAKKPLKELRRRQKLTKQQIGRAFEPFEQRNDLALGNLQVMERHLAAAIDQKVFG